MVKPCMKTLISQKKCQTIHSRYHFFLFHTEPGSVFFFPQFLICTNLSRIRSLLPSPTPCSTVCSSFHLVSIVYVYIQYLRYQNLCLLNDFFLWILFQHISVQHRMLFGFEPKRNSKDSV